jgi:hypothetical protein
MSVEGAVSFRRGARVCLCLALLLFSAAGCISTIKPEPCQVPALPSPAQLRLTNITESYSGPPLGVSIQNKIANPLGDVLRQPGLCLVSDDPANLSLQLDVNARYINHPEVMLSAFLCGLTLGIFPVFVTEEWELTCQAKVCMPDGTVVKNYQFKQPVSLEVVCLPPGLFTLLGACIQEADWQRQMQSAGVQNLAAKLAQAIASDYTEIRLAKEKGLRQQRVIARLLQEEETGTPAPVTSVAVPAASTPGAPAVPKPSPPPSPQRPIVISDNSSVAVVIGISDYVFLGKIPGCEADAKAFAEAFRESRQMNPDNVVVMTDSGDKSHLPTKSMIESRISLCVSEAKPDGIALVYFSGHAMTQDGKALLVPKDCEAGDGIPIDSVVGMLEQSPARDKVLIIDACHASAEQKGVLVIAKEPAQGAAGVAMFLSCGEKENSYPLENGEKSVYTDIFLRALEEDSSASAAVTARSLEAKIEDKMREWRLQTGLRQTPRLVLAKDGDVTLVPKR